MVEERGRVGGMRRGHQDMSLNVLSKPLVMDILSHDTHVISMRASWEVGTWET